jgi:hypothetical protein
VAANPSYMNPRGRRLGRALAAAALLGVLCATALLAGADADPANAAKAKVLGKTKSTPRSYCPKPSAFCESIGSVTGFQTRADGRKQPFVVRQPGHIVAWSLDLTAKPNKVERRFFGKLYGDDVPSARLSILTKRKGKEYRLKHQSPVMQLAQHYGEKPIFTLGRPLRVAKGDVIAITQPSWTSAFSICDARPRGTPPRCPSLSREDNAWRASRSGDRCKIGTRTKTQRQNLRKSRPHDKQGTTRPYACVYESARMLYWAYLRRS